MTTHTCKWGDNGYCEICGLRFSNINPENRTRMSELLDIMLESTDEERLNIYRELKRNFCDGCGCRQDTVARVAGGMLCQCQNDE